MIPLERARAYVPVIAVVAAMIAAVFGAANYRAPAPWIEPLTAKTAINAAQQPASQPSATNETQNYQELVSARDMFVAALDWLAGDVNRLIMLATWIVAVLAYTQWRLSAKTATRQLRAYVFPHEAKMKFLGSTSPAEAVLTLKNSGQTPAYKVDAKAWLGPNFTPMRRDFPFNGPSEPEPYHTVLPPGEVFHGTIYTKIPLPQHAVDAVLAASEIRLYLWGRVDYRDAFDNRRTTHFCFEYDGKKGFAQSRYGNRAN